MPKKVNVSEGIKNQIAEWLLDTRRKRAKGNALQKELGLTTGVFQTVVAECRKRLKVQFEEGERLEGHDSDWLSQQGTEIDLSLIESAKKGNSLALKLYYQIVGRLVEKSETKHKFELTADEYSRIWASASERVRRLYGDTDRKGSLSAKPALLPEKLRVDSGQDIPKDD